MTIFLNHFQQTRAASPLYIEGRQEPIEMIPDTEVRLTLNIDLALHVGNLKLAALAELARSFTSLVEDAEKAESEPQQWPEGQPYVSKSLKLTELGERQMRGETEA